jgi:hypothetical protein
MPDKAGAPEAGLPMYTHGFLPAVYQPTFLRPGAKPVLNLDLPTGVSLDERRQTIDLIRRLNEANLPGADAEFAARISAYDTAFKMQTEAPEVFDISKESKETLDLYGVGDPVTDDYGRRCLLARRLVERGVRFVVVVSGGGPANMQWDAHNDIEENHLRMAANTDRPIAGLLQDLKQRGLLESTLVLWGGEFGRTATLRGRPSRPPRSRTGGITMRRGSPCGWPGAACAGGCATGPPTTMASKPSRTACTCTTCTPRFWPCSVSITPA